MISYSFGQYFLFQNYPESQGWFQIARTFQSHDGYIPGLDHDINNLSSIINISPRHNPAYQSIDNIVSAYPNDPLQQFNRVYFLARTKMTNQEINLELNHLDQILNDDKDKLVEAFGDRHFKLSLQLVDLKVKNITKKVSNNNFNPVKGLIDNSLELIKRFPPDNDELNLAGERFLFRCSCYLSDKIDYSSNDCDNALSETCFSSTNPSKVFWPDLKQQAQSSLALRYVYNLSKRKCINNTKAIEFLAYVRLDPKSESSLPPHYYSDLKTLLNVSKFAALCSDEVKQFIQTKK